MSKMGGYSREKSKKQKEVMRDNWGLDTYTPQAFAPKSASLLTKPLLFLIGT